MARWFLSASVNRMRRARGGAPPLAWRERSLQPAVSPSHAIHTNCRPDLVQRLLVSSCALQGLLIIRYAQDDYVALAFLHIKVFQVLLLLRDELRLSTRALSSSQFLLATLFWAVIVSLRASIALTTSSILLMMLASVVPSSPDASMMSINSSLFFLVSWLRCNVFPSPGCFCSLPS